MAEKKITRKVISKGKSSLISAGKSSPIPKPPVKEEFAKEEKSPENGDGESKETRAKRFCYFCKNKSVPTYTDISTLRRFLTDRAKILAKQRSGVCSKHQRGVSKNIKYARHLSLLPFVPKI